MPKIFARMGFCALGAFTDASYQDSEYLGQCKPKDLPLFLQTRMSSAIASWHGYINALYKGHGTYKEYGGLTYSGAIRHGFPHGQGILAWPNGDRYEGQWEKGDRHGQGIFIRANGDRYKGQWRAGQPHGNGTKTWVAGDRYEGQWEAGHRHGQGAMIWADGDKYEGRWAKDWPGDFKENSNLFTFEDFKSPIQKKPYLQAIILQSTSDYNDAFGIKKGDCDRLANALAVGGYKSRVIYFSSPKELKTTLGTVGEKIDLAWIRAHGSGPEIDCGSRMGDEKTLSSLTPLFNESCSVVFESCRTGELKMLAEKYFQILCESGKSPTVIAPNGIAFLRGIDLDALKNGELKVVMLTKKGAIKDIATTYSKK